MHEVVVWEGDKKTRRREREKVVERDTFQAANRFLITLGNIFVGYELLMVMNVIIEGCLIVPLFLGVFLCCKM